MDIKCRRYDCKHNKHEICKLNAIDVDKDTLCQKFEKDNEKEIEPKAIFEKAPKIAPFKAYTKMDIKCDADCQFAKNGECFANGITVLDDEKNGKETAPCGTFLKKAKPRQTIANSTN